MFLLNEKPQKTVKFRYVPFLPASEIADAVEEIADEKPLVCSAEGQQFEY